MDIYKELLSLKGSFPSLNFKSSDNTKLNPM